MLVATHDGGVVRERDPVLLQTTRRSRGSRVFYEGWVGADTRVVPCATEDIPRPAPRPAYSVLESERGHCLPHWREGLDAYLGVRA